MEGETVVEIIEGVIVVDGLVRESNSFIAIWMSCGVKGVVV